MTVGDASVGIGVVVYRNSSPSSSMVKAGTAEVNSQGPIDTTSIPPSRHAWCLSLQSLS